MALARISLQLGAETLHILSRIRNCTPQRCVARGTSSLHTDLHNDAMASQIPDMSSMSHEAAIALLKELARRAPDTFSAAMGTERWGSVPSSSSADAPMASAPGPIAPPQKRARREEPYGSAGSGSVGGVPALWSLGPHPAAEIVLHPTRSSPPSARGFDMSRVRLRHVALHVAYLGKTYWGYASQEAGGGDVGGNAATPIPTPSPQPDPSTIPPTVETVLFAALRKACLVEVREGAGYTRCGRTDKGVSAAGQMLSLRVRSKALRRDVPGVGPQSRRGSASSATDEEEDRQGAGVGVGVGDMGAAAADVPAPPIWTRCDGLSNCGDPFPPPSDEIDYALVLNALLPPDIRVLGWADVPDVFSARFSCTGRTYRYFFPRRDLDVSLMRKAASVMQGRHDFRNLCRIDIGNTQNFVRDVLSVRVVRVGGLSHPVPSAGLTGHGPATALSNTFARPPLPTSLDSGTGAYMAPFSAEWRAAVAASDSSLDNPPSSPPCHTDLYALEVVGTAFLWHQVRCIAGLLILVGRGLENEASVTALLDPATVPSRPSYAMAAEGPLLLHHCGFGEDGEQQWAGRKMQAGEQEGEGEESTPDPTRPARFLRSYPPLYDSLRACPIALRRLTLDLERVWAEQAVGAAHTRCVLERLYATRVCEEEVLALLREERARASGRQGHPPSMAWTGPRVGESKGKWGTWGQALARHGTALLPLADAEYPLPGGIPSYKTLLARPRGKAVEQRWAELSAEERGAISVRHRTNAAALDCKVAVLGLDRAGEGGAGEGSARDDPT